MPCSLRVIDRVLNDSNENAFGASITTTIIGIDLRQERSIRKVLYRLENHSLLDTNKQFVLFMQQFPVCKAEEARSSINSASLGMCSQSCLTSFLSESFHPPNAMQFLYESPVRQDLLCEFEGIRLYHDLLMNVQGADVTHNQVHPERYRRLRLCAGRDKKHQSFEVLPGAEQRAFVRRQVDCYRDVAVPCKGSTLPECVRHVAFAGML